MARTRPYRSGTLALEGFPVSEVSRYLEEPNAVVWLDLCRPEPADFAEVGEELGLHELALEDAVRLRRVVLRSPSLMPGHCDSTR